MKVILRKIPFVITFGMGDAINPDSTSHNIYIYRNKFLPAPSVIAILAMCRLQTLRFLNGAIQHDPISLPAAISPHQHTLHKTPVSSTYSSQSSAPSRQPQIRSSTL